jgi:ABC-type nitrate/sulfonate/bicarbonate transport system substrate-binding protein
VRSNIKTPADLKGKKVTISRFGSGSDIITRVALRYWKLDPDKDVSFFNPATRRRGGGADRRPHGRGA